MLLLNEAAFPNIRPFLKIYIIIPHLEAVVSHVLQNGPYNDKEVCSLEDEPLDMLKMLKCKNNFYVFNIFAYNKSLSSVSFSFERGLNLPFSSLLS